MTSAKEESFLNDLNLTLEEAWDLLVQGAKDRHSPLHTPAIGTVTADGAPSQRIMVLREVDRDTHRLRFNTDVRVAKVSDIGDSAPVSVLGYHPAAKVQLRLSGTGHIQQNGATAEQAWDEASLYGKRCYLADPAPGQPVNLPTSGLDPAIEGQKPTNEQVIPARSNFSVLLVDVEKIEWLYLAHTGHRRANFIWNEEVRRWDGQWLVP